MRTQGKDRPVSVIQLIMDAKNEARALPSKEIEKFFKCVKQGTLAILPSTAPCTSQSFFLTCLIIYWSLFIILCVVFIHFTDGVYLPVKSHDAVPLEDVQWLAEFMNGDPKVPFSHAIHILRRKNYPFFYDPHPWVAGILTN